MKHIPNRYFSHTFSMEDRWDFIDNYKGEEWDRAKAFMKENNANNQECNQDC